VLAGGTVLGISGRLLGIEELFVLAAAPIILVVVATWQVRARPLQLVASRELHPDRVHAGTASRVELSVRNRSTHRSPVVSVRDPFDKGRRQARFLLAPLHPGEVARAAYRLPTDRRGVFGLGPLEISRADPFGIVTVTTTGAPATQLTVYPHVDVVVPLPHTIGHDPYAGTDHPNALGNLGEDFYALRPYEMGDDLRRVHWKSTARVDELMIRQDEMPWQGRVTVLLDHRRRAHTGESLELAVSAAASILSAGWRRRSLVRLVTSDGVDSGFAAGIAHTEAILEHLATVQASRHDRLTDVLVGLRRSGNGGARAAVATGGRSVEIEALARLRGRFGVVTLVLFEPSSYGVPTRGEVAAPPPPPGTQIVRVTAATPFPQAWNVAMAMARSPRLGARS